MSILSENSTEFAEWTHTNRNGTIVKWKFSKGDSGKYYSNYSNYGVSRFDVHWNEEKNNPELCIIFNDCEHSFQITQPKIPIGKQLIMDKLKRIDNISDSRIICQRKILFTKEPCFLNGKIDQCWKEHS